MINRLGTTEKGDQKEELAVTIDKRLAEKSLCCRIFLSALRHDGGPQAASQIVRKFVKVGVSVDLDGLFGGVADDVAVVAPLEVILQLRLCLGIDGVVEIIC